MVRADEEKCNVLLKTLHLLLDCESDHQRAKHVPEEVHHTVVEKYCSHQAPDLELVRDVVGEFGLKSVQRADPSLLVAVFVSIHGGVNHFGQNEDADAEQNEERCDGSGLEVREEGLKTLEAFVAVGVGARNVEAV